MTSNILKQIASGLPLGDANYISLCRMPQAKKGWGALL